MILLVRNPASGSADEADRDKVEEIIRSADKLRVLEPSSEDSFSEELIAAVKGVSKVIVAGGDGSINLAVNSLRDRLGDLRFGLIPAGTGNDLARTLDLPEDPGRAAEVAVGRNHAHLDVGRATGPGFERLFVNACMGGFPVQVDRSISERAKERLGPLAFWAGGLKAMSELQHFRVWVDDESPVDAVVAAGIGNGRTSGGGIEVWPEADPGDGLLDLCVLPAESLFSGVQLMAKVRKGHHVDLPQVEYRRSARFHVESSPEMEFNLDGELTGLRTPVTFDIFGDARVAVP